MISKTSHAVGYEKTAEFDYKLTDYQLLNAVSVFSSHLVIYFFCRSHARDNDAMTSSDHGIFHAAAEKEKHTIFQTNIDHNQERLMHVDFYHWRTKNERNQ